MKFLVKVVLLVALFFTSFLYFLPKKNIYFQLEKELYKKHVVILDETFKEKPFGLLIKNMEVFYDGLNAGIASNLDFTSCLFFTKIDINKVRVSKSFEHILPLKIDEIIVEHKVFSFSKVNIVARGDFGEIKGFYDIFEKKIVGELKPSSLVKSKYKMILRTFKLKNGKYEYEFKF